MGGWGGGVFGVVVHLFSFYSLCIRTWHIGFVLSVRIDWRGGRYIFFFLAFVRWFYDGLTAAAGVVI